MNKHMNEIMLLKMQKNVNFAYLNIGYNPKL